MFFNSCAGDGMPIANFCNGSMTAFSNTSSFVPGQDVTITCSLPSGILVWDSPQFTLGPVVLSDNPILGPTSGTRLDGAIVFTLTNVTDSPSECATATATIANIQESMQGLSLSCNDGSIVTTVTIDVIGKLHVKFELNDTIALYM